MALVPTPVLVTDVVTTVLEENGNRKSYNIRNLGPNTVYLSGSSDVTSSGENKGYPIQIGDALGVTGDTDTLYGVCAAAETANLNIFEIVSV